MSDKVTLVKQDGDRRVWQVSLWSGLGSDPGHNHYQVTTRRLPSGLVEAVGPDGRRRRLRPEATQCTCWSAQIAWRCLHMRAVAAHVEAEKAEE